MMTAQLAYPAMMHRVNNVELTASVLPAKIPIFEIAWIIPVAYAPEMGSLLLALLKYFAPRVLITVRLAQDLRVE